MKTEWPHFTAKSGTPRTYGCTLNRDGSTCTVKDESNNKCHVSEDGLLYNCIVMICGCFCIYWKGSKPGWMVCCVWGQGRECPNHAP